MDVKIEEHIGIFTILSLCDNKSKDGHKLYHVKCDYCNKEFTKKLSDIKRPKQCSHDKYLKNFNNKRIHDIFSKMIDRCYKKTTHCYRWYGAKGIKIYKEWLNNPLSFEKWALENGYADNLTIDRIDENKDYHPDNCRWITLENNVRYKSTTDLITIDSKTLTGRQWAKELKLGCNVINTYVRAYGKENTIEFIKKLMKNPKLKEHREVNQSYYDLYMN